MNKKTYQDSLKYDVNQKQQTNATRKKSVESDIHNLKHRGKGNSLYGGNDMRRDMTKINLNSENMSNGSPNYDPFVNLAAEAVETPDDRSFVKKKKIITKKYNKYGSKNEKKYIEKASEGSPTKTRASSQ
jgi:hypothetical protein